MKQRFTLLIAASLAFSANAQLAKKYAYFEHFTQASCGPCAAQNPTFQTNILNYYNEGVHHVAYHTSWPGVDPMNSHNAPQVSSRVSFYGVNGVPNMQMNGINKDSPANITQDMVNQIFTEGSPVKVDVTQTVDASNVNIKVIITTVGDKPAGTYRLMTAVVEKIVKYTSPPGSNGERDFPNVFRKMATTDNGDAITIPEKGQSLELNYTVPLNSVWKSANIISMAAIQSTAANKAVLNSGSSTDIPSPITYGLLGDPAKSILNTTTGVAIPVILAAKNTGSSQGNFKIAFNSDMPADWTAVLNVNGTALTSGNSATVALDANSSSELTVSVTPGATAYIGQFTVTFESPETAGTIKFTRTFKVISNVKDLVISNTDAVTSKLPKDFASIYMNGLTNAGNNQHAADDNNFLLEALKTGALTGVKSIYYNVGYSTGSLPLDLVTQLKKFMDAGGNVLIAGQDIAYEYCDAASQSYSGSTQNFLNKYFHVGYEKDATTSQTMNSEEFYGALGTVNLNTNYYSGSYYPDVIKVITTGIPVLRYDDGTIAGIRSMDATKKFRSVYLAVGPEQMASNTKKEEFIKMTHDYFYSNSVGINTYDAASNVILGDVYPNPAKDKVEITFGNMEKDMSLVIVDVTGKQVFQQGIWTGMDHTTVNIENFTSGLYFYQLVDGGKVIATKKLTVLN